MSLQVRKVGHEGGVNRIRAMRQHPHICASWADTGVVQVQFSCLGAVFMSYDVCLSVYVLS